MALTPEEIKKVNEEFNDLVNQLELNDIVSLHCEYIPENQLLTTLSNYDLIVFPYQMSSESSSASVRDGLASLKQVIVTPLPIFDDIYDLVDFFEGTSPDHMAKGIMQWYERLKTDPHAIMKTHLKRISKICSISK